MNNPPAFPAFDREGRASDVERGMTLRDYFATAALQGLISNRDFGAETTEYLSDQAYIHADAMLKRRNK